MAAYTTIDDPSAHFKVQLYTGNATDDTAISFNDTDTTMQPDFIWIKNRSADGDHSMVDVVRGLTKYFTSSGNDEEQTYTNSVTAIGSDAYTFAVNFGGCPAFAISSGNADDNGHGNFEYSPNITGDGSAKKFYAICTKNLAEFG